MSPAVMDGPKSSKTKSNYIGRIIVIIPKLDYGFIKKEIEKAVTVKNNPASTQMEILAVKVAKEICEKKKINEYSILTDNTSASTNSNVPETKLLEQGEIHLASLFMERIMNRARYLRQSSRKTIKRTKTNKLQLEIYQMFEADNLDFKLSESMLWQKIQMEMEAEYKK